MTWTACTARSRRITPTTRAHSELRVKAKGNHEAASTARAMPVVRRESPRSFRRPATVAARAPVTPISPSAPIALWVRKYGAWLSGSATLLHRVLKAAKISRPNRARSRSSRSRANRVIVERRSCP